MLLWNLYFLIKFGLHFAGQLTLSPLWNLALFALLLATNPAAFQNRRLMALLRYVLFVGPATALLLHELGLVVSLALVDQIRALFGFSVDYLLELTKRTIQPWMLWGALAAFMLIRVLDRYFRISTWVGVGLLAVLAMQTAELANQDKPDAVAQAKEPLAQARENLSPAELLALGQVDFQKLRVARDQESSTKLRDNTNEGVGPGAVLQGFFDKQQALVTAAFAPPLAPDFDVIVLQICSLSWADMQYAKQGQHPALRQADFIFENFNSATSYSGPAAIRLLRGQCGQARHDDLYKSPSDSCMLFEQLRNAGFDVEMGLNHDGKFQDFSLAYTRRVLAQLKRTGVDGTDVPRIVFTKGGGIWLEDMKDIDCEVLGLDWTANLGRARAIVGGQPGGPGKALQGNIDPNVLFAPPAQIEQQVRHVLDSFGTPHTDRSTTGPTHIFNLGHGISQYTPPEHVAALVEAVHSHSRAQRQG